MQMFFFKKKIIFFVLVIMFCIFGVCVGGVMPAMAVAEKDRKKILKPEPLELELSLVVRWPAWV